ncbi:hypothetical protein MRX96_002248 [Rhipicephalus microplus]
MSAISIAESALRLPTARGAPATPQSQPRNATTLANNPPSPGACVNVAVTVRPLNERESETPSVVCVGDDRCLVLDPKAEAESVNFRGQRACPDFVKPHKDYTFMFEKVFGEAKDNKYVFERTTKEMLPMLLDCCNCSVFAYGLRSKGQSCDVVVAYTEVYNEVVRDLLCPKGPSLVVRDDPAKGIAFSNLSIHKVKESGALFEFLQKGNRNKTHQCHPCQLRVVAVSYNISDLHHAD